MTIGSEKTIILDMNGKTLSIGFSDSSKNLIVNNGTLTVVGEGIFDATKATSYKGFINNYGTLTVENGTFQIADNAMTVHLRNQSGGKAVINGGTFSGGATIVRSFANSNTTITGGSFTNSIYPAVDVNGETLITGGSFTNKSCSKCDPKNWGYTIRSGVDNDPNAKLTITPSSEGDVVVTGTQGGLTAVAGKMEVNGGSYKTEDCDKQHGAVFYALYVAGEAGKVQVVVNDGTFVTEGNYTAVLVGNSNDGGLKEQAVLQIKGGQFSAPDGVPAYKVDVSLGGLNVSGGTFSSKVDTSYLASGMVQAQDGTVGALDDVSVAELWRAGTFVSRHLTLEDALNAAQDHDTVMLAAGKEISLSKPVEISGKVLTLDLHGSTIKAGNGFQGNRIITVSAGGDLTIMDTSSGETGAIAGADRAIVVSGSTSKAMIQGGTLSGNKYAALVTDGSSLEISGGTLTMANSATSTEPAIQVQLKSSLEISGGAIIGGQGKNGGAVNALSSTVKLSGNAKLTGYSGVALFNVDGNFGLSNAPDAVSSILTMTGGTIEAKSFALSGNNTQSAGSMATISGGTLTANDGTAIYWPMEGKLTIGGDAVIIGGTGIEAKMGTIS